jgi:hypothetical protein
MRKPGFLLGLICWEMAAQDAALEATAVNPVTGEPVSGVNDSIMPRVLAGRMPSCDVD